MGVGGGLGRGLADVVFWESSVGNTGETEDDCFEVTHGGHT
jgi:hypothetical protein